MATVTFNGVELEMTAPTLSVPAELLEGGSYASMIVNTWGSEIDLFMTFADPQRYENGKELRR